MQKEIKLSIIIVNFNTYQYLSRCIDSIFKEGFSHSSLEIIIVDNASTDNSVNLLQRHYPQVIVVSNNKNIGFAAANNQGINRAKGKFILLLNPDTLVAKSVLIKMLHFIDQHPDVGIASCKVVLPTGNLDDACHRGFPTPWNAFCQFSGLSGLFPESQFFNGYHLGYKDMKKVHEIDSCAGAFMLVRKDAGDQVHWFDTDYFWYGEDIDFCFRVKKRGWKIMFVPNYQIIHYKGIASGIKKHSKKDSTATIKTKLQATKARFEVMKIFYNKHYRKIYPSWLNCLVYTGIKIKAYLTEFKNTFF